MATGLLDDKKKREILNKAGPEFIARLDANYTFMKYLVKAGVINHLDSKDMEEKSPSQRRNSIFHRLYSIKILHFIYFCIILHDYCNQPDIVKDVFNLDIEQLRTQKDQIEARPETLKGEFPPTRRPQNEGAPDAHTHHPPSYLTQPPTSVYVQPQAHCNPPHIHQLGLPGIPSYSQSHPGGYPWVHHYSQQQHQYVGPVTDHTAGSVPCVSTVPGVLYPPVHLQHPQPLYSHPGPSAPPSSTPRTSSQTAEHHDVQHELPSKKRRSAHSHQPGPYFTQPPTSVYVQPQAHCNPPHIHQLGLPGIPSYSQSHPGGYPLVHHYSQQQHQYVGPVTDHTAGSVPCVSTVPGVLYPPVHLQHPQPLYSHPGPSIMPPPPSSMPSTSSLTAEHHDVQHRLPLKKRRINPRDDGSAAHSQVRHPTDGARGVTGGGPYVNEATRNTDNPSECHLRGSYSLPAYRQPHMPPIPHMVYTPRPSAPDTAARENLPTQKPDKWVVTRTLNKFVLFCSFILEDKFDAGDSDPRAPEYHAFVARIEHGIKVTLQEYTRKLLRVVAMCISQLKRMVLIRIECSEILTEREIQDALMSPINELNRSSLRVCPGTLLFRDEIPALLVLDVVTKRHMEDSLGRKIDFERQYVMLKILSPDALTAVKRDVLERPDKYQCLLQKSDGREIKDEDIISPGEVVKYVLVRGRAGIGKSTLVQRLMWRWAHGEWARHIKVIFLLNVRHLMAMVPSMDLAHLLSRFAVYKVQHDAILDPKWLEENQRQVVFIADGVDEILRFREEWEKTQADMSLTMEAPALDWVFGILRRRCLQQSSVIVTSRPFADLSHVEPSMLVEVMGLTRERVMEFIEKNVETQRVTTVKETMERQPILLSVSSITFYCAALCQVLQDDTSVTNILTTYTQITAYIMERFIDHSFKRLDIRQRVQDLWRSSANKQEKCLQALMRLAYDGISKSRDGGLAQLVFSAADLEQQNVTSEHVETARQSGMFMQTEVPSADSTDKKQTISEFVHLSIQEFFSMIGLLRQTPTEVKEALKMMSSSGQFNMALLFLYGFAFDRNSEAIKRLCEAFGLTLHVSNDILKVLEKNIKKGGAKLQVLQMMHETQSPEVARLVGESRFPHEVKINKAKMTVVDVLALKFLLKNHPPTTSIILEHVGLDVISVKELCSYLEEKSTLTSLRIQDRGLDDECRQLLMKALLVNRTITNLSLDVGLNHSSIEKLCQLLKASNTTIQSFMIQDREIDAECRQLLMQAIQVNRSITNLSLDVGMNPAFMRELQQCLMHNNIISDLMIPEKGLDDECLQLLTEALQVNQSITNLKIEVSRVERKRLISLAVLLLQKRPVTSLKIQSVLERKSAESHLTLNTDGTQTNVSVMVGGDLRKGKQSIDGYFMQDADIKALCDILVSNSTLKDLTMSCYEVTAAGLMCLWDALKSNNTLVKLTLYMILQDESAAGLLGLMTVNDTVTISIGYAQCSPSVQQQLKDHPRIQVKYWM